MYICKDEKQQQHEQRAGRGTANKYLSEGKWGEIRVVIRDPSEYQPEVIVGADAPCIILYMCVGVYVLLCKGWWWAGLSGVGDVYHFMVEASA